MRRSSYIVGKNVNIAIVMFAQKFCFMCQNGDGTYATFEKFAKKIKPLYSVTSYMYIIRSRETSTLKKAFLPELLIVKFGKG